MVQLSSLAFAACTVLTFCCSQLGAGGSVWAGSTDLGHRSTLARQLISRGLDSLPGIPSTTVIPVSQEQSCWWGLICTKPAEVLSPVLFPLQVPFMDTTKSKRSRAALFIFKCCRYDTFYESKYVQTWLLSVSEQDSTVSLWRLLYSVVLSVSLVKISKKCSNFTWFVSSCWWCTSKFR